MFGNTGCGKSTLILSLVYGSAALHEVRISGHKHIELNPEVMHEYL